jgi:hypothetical protein
MFGPCSEHSGWGHLSDIKLFSEESAEISSPNVGLCRQRQVFRPIALRFQSPAGIPLPGTTSPPPAARSKAAPAAGKFPTRIARRRESPVYIEQNRINVKNNFSQPVLGRCCPSTIMGRATRGAAMREVGIRETLSRLPEALRAVERNEAAVVNPPAQANRPDHPGRIAGRRACGRGPAKGRGSLTRPFLERGRARVRTGPNHSYRAPEIPEILHIFAECHLIESVF